MVVEMIHSQMTSYCTLGVNLGILEYGPVPGLIFCISFLIQVIGSSLGPGRLGISTRVVILIRTQLTNKYFKKVKGILLGLLSPVNTRLIIMTHNKFFGTFVR